MPLRALNPELRPFMGGEPRPRGLKGARTRALYALYIEEEPKEQLDMVKRGTELLIGFMNRGECSLTVERKLPLSREKSMQHADSTKPRDPQLLCGDSPARGEREASERAGDLSERRGRATGTLSLRTGSSTTAGAAEGSLAQTLKLSPHPQVRRALGLLKRKPFPERLSS